MNHEIQREEFISKRGMANMLPKSGPEENRFFLRKQNHRPVIERRFLALPYGVTVVNVVLESAALESGL